MVTKKGNHHLRQRQIDWERFNIHQTHYRSYVKDVFLRVKWPNQQCQSTEGR